MLNHPKIFISYARADAQEFAMLLTSDLHKAGANIWLDQLEIEGGTNYHDAIQEALDNATCVLYVVSINSLQSRYVKSEVTYAIEEGKKVIPLLLHEGKLSFLFSSLQKISFIDDYQRGLQDLLKALKIGMAAVPEPVSKEYPLLENKSKAGKATWVCSKNPSHVFDKPTEDNFCPICPAYDGFLIKETFQSVESITSSPVFSPEPITYNWVCSADNAHVFDEDTTDHFCPVDPPYHGILIKLNVQNTK